MSTINPSPDGSHDDIEYHPTLVIETICTMLEEIAHTSNADPRDRASRIIIMKGDALDPRGVDSLDKLTTYAVREMIQQEG